MHECMLFGFSRIYEFVFSRNWNWTESKIFKFGWNQNSAATENLTCFSAKAKTEFRSTSSICMHFSCICISMNDKYQNMYVYINAITFTILCACMYVRIYMCMYLNIYVWLYVFLYAYRCVCMFIRCTCMCVYVCTYVCTVVCLYICI